MSQVLHLNSVTWIRGNDTILNNISWVIESGQHWALLGPNGAGKTSLLNIINGYQWPTQGSVSVLGQRFGTVDLRDLRRNIGWVSPSVMDWLGTHHGGRPVQEVVWAGYESRMSAISQVPSHIRKKAATVMTQLGLESMQSKPLLQLSQGERQKVLLARAWMADLQLLILDEPAQGLDLRAREEFLQYLSAMVKIAGAPAIIYVTHQVEEILPWITHAFLLQRGKTVAQGRVVDVLTEDKLSRCYGVPVNVTWRNQRPWLYVSGPLSIPDVF